MPPKDQFRDSATRLRARIDSGRTAEKVPAIDPAAAPLGTDDEAAGTTSAGEPVEEDRTGDALPNVDRAPIAADSRSVPSRTDHRPVAIWAVLMVMLCLAVLAVALAGWPDSPTKPLFPL